GGPVTEVCCSVQILGEVVFVRAVEHVFVLIWSPPVGTDPSGPFVPGPRSRWERARRQHRQTREIAAIQWQVNNALALDHLAEVGRFRLQSWCSSLHFDSLGDLTDLKNYVDADAILHVHNNAGSHSL